MGQITSNIEVMIIVFRHGSDVTVLEQDGSSTHRFPVIPDDLFDFNLHHLILFHLCINYGCIKVNSVPIGTPIEIRSPKQFTTFTSYIIFQS